MTLRHTVTIKLTAQVGGTDPDKVLVAEVGPWAFGVGLCLGRNVKRFVCYRSAKHRTVWLWRLGFKVQWPAGTGLSARRQFLEIAPERGEAQS